MQHLIRSSGAWFGCAALTIVLAGCGSAEPVVVAQAAPTGFTINHLAGMTLAANDAEIQTSQLAQQRASSTAVREFAQRMVTEHTQARDRGRTLYQSEG